MAGIAGATIHHLPITDDTKFRLAMRSLDVALDDQRSAIASMRQAFAALGTTMTNLTNDFAGLTAALDSTQGKIALARAEADRLVATAAFIEGFRAR